jgi:glyceraldehyde-3-phosphate dehydrogenase (NADP+)
MPDHSFRHLRDDSLSPVFKYFDGSAWQTSQSGKTIDVRSPIDDEVIGKVQEVTHGEIDVAIKKATTAQQEWQRTSFTFRARILHLAADWIRSHSGIFTDQLIVEIGKPKVEAADEIVRSADMIDAFVAEGQSIHGEELTGDSFPGYDQTRLALIERVPLGVILAIAPFNYPINLAISKIAPAILMGNTVVFKPPTQGSIAGLMLTEVFHRAGLPAGVLTTLTGQSSTIGPVLVKHQGIHMITFTGSSEVGQEIARAAGMIPLLFECGGNNPALVLPDADLPSTAREIVKGAFSYSGQRCTAIKYVLGMKHTLESLLPIVLNETTGMKTGDPRHNGIAIGPVISDNAAGTIEHRIIAAKAEGARIECGGRRVGRMITPTILTNVPLHAQIVLSETFGPVVSFIEIPSIDRAIEIINTSSYGLQVSVFTKDEGAGIRIGRLLNTGSIQINSKPQRGPDNFPFLGIRGSGIGVQGIRYSLESMTRPKPIILNKPQ